MKRTTILCVAIAVILSSPKLSLAETSIEGFVESETLPIRIYYQESTDDDLVQYTLEQSEWAYQEHVDRGWTPPHSMEEDGTPVQRLDMFLIDVQGMASAAIVQTLGNNDETSWTDSLLQILVHRGESMSTIGGTIVYGVNHAFQMAEDSLEAPSTYEMFDVHTTHVLLPDDPVYYFFVPGFQAEPHRAFYTYSTTNYMFHFGAALFIQFLDERYSSGDATLDAQLWRAARQDGEISLDSDGFPISSTPNEPDILDSIVSYLQMEQDTTLEDALIEFAQWRLLVGEYDDGEHFSNAAELEGAEVTFDEIYHPQDLPIVEAMPLMLPYPTGTSFIRVDLDDSSQVAMLEVKVSCNETTSWSAQVIRILEDSPAEVVHVELAGQAGEASVPASGAEHLVLAVTNLGDGSLDGDEHPEDAEFIYSLALNSQPQVTSIAPSGVTAGTSNVEVVVVASPLHEDATLDLGSGIAVNDVSIEGDQLIAMIDIDLTAEPGLRDVIVSIPGVDPGMLDEGFEVVAPPGPEIAHISPDEVTQGESANLVITGSSFLEGAIVSLGEGINIDSVEVEGATQIVLDVHVEDDALAGSRVLTVTNPGGEVGSLDDALEVVAADSEGEGGPDSDDDREAGCSCRQASGTTDVIKTFAALIGALVW